MKELALLTAKPQLLLLNGSEADVSDELRAKISELGTDYMVADLGQVTMLTTLIRQAYETLKLITFFTTSYKETRGWTVRQGAKAPEAAGVIHTDFEEKFIRAEVVGWQKL